MYAKLVNGELIAAPQDLVLEDGKIIVNFNRSIAKMLEHGYRPVIDSKPGYDVDTQYCRFVNYTDNGRYIRAEYTVENIEFSELEIQTQEAQKAMEFLNIDLQEQIQMLPAEQALEVSSLYPDWMVGVDYKVGYMVNYEGVLYKVLQAHTSQADWTPDVAHSIFAKVLVGDEVQEWEQPEATNPYMKGDRVMYKGVMYESVIDNNVWSPEAYASGWKIVEE